MNLKNRITLYFLSLAGLVVVLTSLSTVLTIRHFVGITNQNQQRRIFNQFRQSTVESLLSQDKKMITSMSKSLEKSVPGLAYAVYIDKNKRNQQWGGLMSKRYFSELTPTCQNSGVLFSNQTVSFEDRRTQGQDWRVFCEEIQLARGSEILHQGTLFMGFNMDVVEIYLGEVFNDLWKTLLWVLFVVFVVGFVFSYYLSQRLTAPLYRLSEGVRALGEGNLDIKLPVEGNDELSFLTQEFNVMAKKLKELDQLKSEFVSSVSHEMKSPLAAIAGYVEFLTSKPWTLIAPTKREKALEIIHSSVERLNQFIGDVLDMAKLKSGKLTLFRDDVHVPDLCEDILGLYAPYLEKKQISTELGIPDYIPLVHADREKIRQVLTNLISNALKFTPTGGKIRIGAKNQVEFVQIYVEDNGVGIPDEAKELVFERFRQINRPEDQVLPDVKGAGLGLAIAKGIVESHQGQIWIESAVGGGTRVNFTLPKSRVSHPELASIN